MEGDWSSREGRLPRLDREGRTLSDSEYCLPSPPERDLSAIHLSQVSLDGGYGGDVSSEAGTTSDVLFHHCQQPSYAHSEGYYSYVSSTDSITPFIDRLKRELEFTEVQENSSASSHGGTSVKWEESDTDTFVAPRERSVNKTDSDSVWHFRGSSGDLVNTSSRSGLTNNSSRLASPPLSSDSSRAGYLSRVPLFHNASYESVNIDHASRISAQSHVANSHPTGVTHSSRSQIGHGCTTNNSSKTTRSQANHCRSCDVAYGTGRLQPSLDQGDIPYPSRLHSNGSACDSSGSERVSQPNIVSREQSVSRIIKAQPQLSHSSRLQSALMSSNSEVNSNSSRKYSCDSTNHSSRINSNQNESHHSSRISSNLSDSAHHSNRLHSNHNESGSVRPNLNESSNHSTRPHSDHNNDSNHPRNVHSSLGDPTSRSHSNHNESSNHSHSNKIYSGSESANITHSTRMLSNHCDSSNHSSRLHSNHNDGIMNSSCRGYSSRGSSGDFVSGPHLSRSHSNHSSSSEAVNHDVSSRHSVKGSGCETPISHPSRMPLHSSLSVCSDSTTGHPTRVTSHSSLSSESSGSTHPSRVLSHSSLSISSESSNTSHPRLHSNSSHAVNTDPSRVHSSLSLSNHSLGNDSTSSSRPRLHSHSNNGSDPAGANHQPRLSNHSVNTESSTTNHGSRNLPHSNAGESTSVNHPLRIHSHSSIGESAPSRMHSHSSVNNESSNSSLSSRVYTHSSHSVSSESANIARSSRVPPPQRHLSQSVLYLSADHRKLFPISTYQPEPPRVVGAVSVSERVVELENRLGGLKALQKKALLSFYQRHQATAPAPPPPPRRASSASDYLQLKGCIETGNSTSVISNSNGPSSNGLKETSSASNTSSSASSNSLLKDARQLHSRSCGSLSGISGPVIVGRSISVDDWVPARPPKGAHLRLAAPRPPTPEPSSTTALSHSRPAAMGLTNSQQTLNLNSSTAPTQSPEKFSGSSRLNNPIESVRPASHRNPLRAASPEPPPPPPSPPQQYSDEPLPPPPDPDELVLPPSLPSRHPSPGPQVPTNQTESFQRSQPEFKIPSDPPLTSTRNVKNVENKLSFRSEDLGISNCLDLKPQKLIEISTLSNSLNDLQLQFNHHSTEKVNSARNLSEFHPQLLLDQQIKLADSEFTELISKSESVASDAKEKPSIRRTNVAVADPQNQNIASEKSDLIDLGDPPVPHQDVHTNPPSDSVFQTKSTAAVMPLLNRLPEVKNNLEPLPNQLSKSLSIHEGSPDNLDPTCNNCAIEPVQDNPVVLSSPKALTRKASQDNLSLIKPQDKTRTDEDVHEETPTHDVKKILRKTSFRCSERIQQSITTLQNSIRSSSPQKFQESQKELLYKDLLSKDILPKDLLKDILSKDLLSSDICKDIITQDPSKSLPKELSKDTLSTDILSKDKDFIPINIPSADKYPKDQVTKDMLSKEAVNKDCTTEERWTSAMISSEPSPSNLSLSLSRLDHIEITEKLISSFTSQKCEGADEKEDVKLDGLSDCDLEKSCSLSPSQLESNISVGSLQQKKEELVTRLSRKLSVLRAEAAAVAEETSANEELGEAVVDRVAVAWGSREACRLRSHVADLGRLTALLLTLTTRLARADNALLALSSCHPDKGVLETKRDRLAGQLEEARRLKEKVDRRNEAVTSKLRERLTSDEFSDFMHFVSLKSKLLLDSREIADKIKLGEEQLQALQMTLSAVT